VPKSYPKEFRDDVVAVARKGEVPLTQIAKNFGIYVGCLSNWMRKADVEDGNRPGVTATLLSGELRDANKPIRLLEQEDDVLRRAAAYLSQVNLPEIVFPLVRAMAAVSTRIRVLVPLPATLAL